MFAYFAIFGLLVFGALARQPQARGGATAGYVAVCVLLTLFVGLRWEVGPDWNGYLVIWENSRLYSLADQLEKGDPGFRLLVWGLREIGATYWSLNLVCATIFMAGIGAFCARLPNPWLGLAIAFPYLIIVVGMSGIRQGTAIGFILFAMNAFSDNKNLKATFWLLVGSMFHASAILVLGIAALSVNRNRLAGVAILAVTALVATNVLQSDFDTYISRYVHRTVTSDGTVFRIAMNLVPAIIYLIWHRRFSFSASEASFWRIISYAAILCVPVGMVVNSTTAIDRFSLYLIPLQISILGRVPYVFSRNKGSYQMFLVGLLAYLTLVLAVFLNFSNFARAWDPYRNVLFVDEDTSNPAAGLFR